MSQESNGGGIATIMEARETELKNLLDLMDANPPLREYILDLMDKIDRKEAKFGDKGGILIRGKHNEWIAATRPAEFRNRYGWGSIVRALWERRRDDDDDDNGGDDGSGDDVAVVANIEKERESDRPPLSIVLPRPTAVAATAASMTMQRSAEELLSQLSFCTKQHPRPQQQQSNNIVEHSPTIATAGQPQPPSSTTVAKVPKTFPWLNDNLEMLSQQQQQQTLRKPPPPPPLVSRHQEALPVSSVQSEPRREARQEALARAAVAVATAAQKQRAVASIPSLQHSVVRGNFASGPIVGHYQKFVHDLATDIIMKQVCPVGGSSGGSGSPYRVEYAKEFTVTSQEFKFEFDKDMMQKLRDVMENAIANMVHEKLYPQIQSAASASPK